MSQDLARGMESPKQPGGNLLVTMLMQMGALVQQALQEQVARLETRLGQLGTAS